MNLLVIGGGGREHAIVRKLKENPEVETIYCLPGNGGIAADAVCVADIGAKDIPAQVAFAKSHDIDFAVVAPDDPLVLGAVDALEVGTNAFSCETNWQNVPLWHTSGAALSGVLGSLNISPALTESRVTDTSSSSSDSESGTLLSVPNLLPMQENGKLPDADASDAMSVLVQFDAQNATGFSYDADSKTYRMLHADGTPQLDANNGQQADFDNLLILFSASTLRDDGVTLDYDLTMGGGVWLNEGHLWNITWTQGSETTFFLYDSNGRPLTLTAGRSYLALVSSLTGQELTVQNSTGENLL